VKKDLRNEHLKKDLQFVKKYLASKNIHKLSTEDLSQAYEKAIQEEESGEEIAEFITSRWLLKNSELYEFFEKELSKISPDFAGLEEIDPSQAQGLIEASNQEFSPPQIYLFSVLNSVVFPKETFEQLKRQAIDYQALTHEELRQTEERVSLEEMKRNFQREMARLTDKYEKKLSGLQKKYIVDVEALKKQVAALQRKLHQEKS
jgi:hypothetical protein